MVEGAVRGQVTRSNSNRTLISMFRRLLRLKLDACHSPDQCIRCLEKRFLRSNQSAHFRFGARDFSTARNGTATLKIIDMKLVRP